MPTGSGLAGGSPIDPAREAERAFLEKQRRQSTNRETPDPGAVAGDLMRGAGYDPADIDRMANVVKQSDRGLAIKKQMSGSAAPALGVVSRPIPF